MGLFSDTTYTVETSTTRVVEDDKVPNSTLRGLTRALMNDGSIPDYLLDAVTQSVGYRSERLFRKAQEIYPEGLLRSRVTSNRGNPGLVKDAIQADTGRVVETLEYAILAPLNYNHQLWQLLVEEYGYDRDSNELTALSTQLGGRVYLDTFQIWLPQELVGMAQDQDTQASWADAPDSGYTPERPANDSSVRQLVAQPQTLVARTDELTTIEAEVSWIRDDQGATNKGSFTRELVESDGGYEHYQAMYTWSGGTAYWTYRYGAGVHTTLDRAMEVSFTDPGHYMPVIFFRSDHENVSHESRDGEEGHKAATELLDILGMSYQEMGDAIHDNEDVGDIRYAYMMFGISANSDDETDVRYLYEFFSDFQDRLPDTGQSVLGFPSGDLEGLLGSSLRGMFRRHLTLNLETQKPAQATHFGAKMTLSARGITKRIRAGRVGERGGYTRARDNKTLVLRHQHTDSSYWELRVDDPVLRHHIDGSGRGTNNGLGDEDLLIPLDHNIVGDWAPQSREAVYARSMHFVFNARDVQKSKWYQSGIFKTILTIAAIVITIYSGFTAWQTIAAAQTLTAAALVVLEIVAIKVAFDYAFSFVVEQLGVEAAMVIAAVALAVGGAKSIKAGSVDGAPWAEELLQVANGLGEAIQEGIGDLLEDVRSDWEEFATERDEKEAELERANALLENTNLLDPLDVVRLQPITIFGENPSDYFERTVHTGNIGTLGIDAIGSYVSNSLKLPTMHSTAGDTIYG